MLKIKKGITLNEEWIDEKIKYIFKHNPSLKKELIKRRFLEPNLYIYNKFETGSEYDLNQIINEVSNYIKLYNIPQAEYEWSLKMDVISAGQYQYPINKIQISVSYVGKPEVCGAIVVHELAHSYAINNSLIFSDRYENELFTDLMIVFLGLGKYFLNGIYVFHNQQGITSTLGYLEPELLVYALKKYCELIECTKSELEQNLNAKALKLVQQVF